MKKGTQQGHINMITKNNHYISKPTFLFSYRGMAKLEVNLENFVFLKTASHILRLYLYSVGHKLVVRFKESQRVSVILHLSWIQQCYLILNTTYFSFIILIQKTVRDRSDLSAGESLVIQILFIVVIYATCQDQAIIFGQDTELIQTSILRSVFHVGLCKA